jgi:hypothetical protein
VFEVFNETGCFETMKVKAIKFLTLLCLLGGIFSSSAQILEQTEFKTHLRWTLNGAKEQALLKKVDNKLYIQTLDRKFFNDLVGDLSTLSKNSSYIKDIEFTADKLPAEPAKLTLTLADDSVELFTFYKDQNKKHIIDFWINKDLVSTKEASVAKVPEVIKVAKIEKPVKKVTKAIEQPVVPVVKINSMSEVLDAENLIQKSQGEGFRDFRYGAAFIWDYEAFIPPLQKDVDLAVKAPSYLFEIKDRDVEASAQDAHMQLTINFYRKEQWGLMTRSINLYEQKYKRDQNAEFNDFMKAVSLIRNLIKPDLELSGLTDKEKKQVAELKANEQPIPKELQVKLTDKGTMQAAINMMSSLHDRTENYELKKACARYVLQYHMDRNDYINSLQMAKKLYVSSTENFDDDMIVLSSKSILFSLANLKQLDKIKEFLSNKAVMRVLPKQEGLAYISYVNLSLGETKQAIADFTANTNSLTKPVHPALLYNTAESLFREAQYEKAIKLYDDLVSSYSYLTISSNANLRIAMSYDLLNADMKKVLNLYENAINRSVDAKVRYESKVRYVGARLARTLNPSSEDKETIAFLDQTIPEKKAIDQNLRKLLWLVRLRTMINLEKYNDAMAYLSTIPLESVSRVDRRTFDGDGAEIVLGLIKEAYMAQDYAKTIKVWEIYRDKYENKVAASTYANFIVADSYLKLGLTESFERAFKTVASLKNIQSRSFPNWVKSHKNISVQDYLIELELGKLVMNREWSQIDTFLNQNRENKQINYNFYKGLVNYNLKKYNEAVTEFEAVLVTPNINNILSPKQSKMMLTNYIESLYQLPDQERFRKNVNALVSDIRRSNKAGMNDMLERFEYLYIESVFGDKKTNFELLQSKTKEYVEAHGNSTYLKRVRFLNGVSLINTSQEEKGKNILEDLINNKETPEYLRGLARSELATLALKNKKM